MNKKGSMLDLIFIAVTLLAFSVVVLIVFKISNTFNSELQDMADLPDKPKDEFNRVNNLYVDVIDNMALFLFVGLSVVALILASLVRFHPVFFVFFILIIVVFIFIAGIMSNIYLEIANNPELSDEAEQLTHITKIMYILPFFIGVIGFILSVIMYKNWRDAS